MIGNRIQLQQVIINLLVNSVQAIVQSDNQHVGSTSRPRSVKKVRSSFPFSTMGKALRPRISSMSSRASSAPRMPELASASPFASRSLSRRRPHLGFKSSERRRPFSLHASGAGGRRVIRAQCRFVSDWLRDNSRPHPIPKCRSIYPLDLRTRTGARYRRAASAIIIRAHGNNGSTPQ